MSVHVMGLDLSLTHTGVAMPNGDTHVLRPKSSGCERYVWLRDAVRLACGINVPGRRSMAQRPDVVVIETVFQGTKGDTALKLAGLGWIVRVALHEAGIPYADIGNAKLKQYATGKGGGPGTDKAAMIATARTRLGYVTDAPDDNEADALWLRAMGLDAYGAPVCDMPQRNRAALASVAWPPLSSVAGGGSEPAHGPGPGAATPVTPLQEALA